MTASEPLPTHSAAEALADVASLGPFFTVRLGGEDRGWHPVHESYARGSADLIRTCAARYGTREERIPASIVQFGHAARLWSPALACTVVHGVVPDFDALHRADDGAALRLPVGAGRRAGPLPDTVEVLHRLVMEQHLDALAAGLRVKVAPRLLDGNAASALIEAARAILRLRPELSAQLTSLVSGLLERGRLAGTGDLVGPDLSFRRRSCCLFYRVPSGGKCGDCCLER